MRTCLKASFSTNWPYLRRRRRRRKWKVRRRKRKHQRIANGVNFAHYSSEVPDKENNNRCWDIPFPTLVWTLEDVFSRYLNDFIEKYHFELRGSPQTESPRSTIMMSFTKTMMKESYETLRLQLIVEHRIKNQGVICVWTRRKRHVNGLQRGNPDCLCIQNTIDGNIK